MARIFLLLMIWTAKFGNVVCPPGSCVDIDPLHTWPLGINTQTFNVETNVTAGFIAPSVTYGEGRIDVGLSAAAFTGSVDSYVDVPVANSTELWESEKPLREDYAISMFAYLDNTDNGTLFHFQSDSYPGSNDPTRIHRVKFYLENGYLTLEYQGVGVVQRTDIQILPNTWYRFTYGRDSSNTITQIGIDDDFDTVDLKNLDWLVTQFPGTLRIGNSFDSDTTASSPFRGKIQCVQIFACKWPCPDPQYYAQCYTESVRGCSMSLPSPANGNVTYNGSLPGDVATYTCNDGYVLVGAATSTCLNDLTWETPGATCQTPTVVVFDLIPRCMHYTMSQTDVTFGDATDVIEVTTVNAVTQCSDRCSRTDTCVSFVVKSVDPVPPSFSCTLGKSTNGLIPSFGATFFVSD